MYDGAKDLQGLQSAVAEPRRFAAAASALIVVAGVAATTPAFAEEQSVKPAITRRGWQLDLTGWIQADSIAFSDESVDEVDAEGDPLNEQRFLIRRGRLRGEARKGPWSGSIEFDGNTIDGATARILAAHAGWGHVHKSGAAVAVSAGLFRSPFGLEVPMAERIKPFLEAPAFARALFPGNYDAGVMAAGAYGAARLTIAMMNGSPAFDAQWRGDDPTSNYEFVARLGAVIDGPRKLRFEVGVSALAGTGLHPGSPGTKDDIQWVDEDQNGMVSETEIRVLPGVAPTPSQKFTRDAVGLDAQVHWCVCIVGNGAAFFEAVLATNLDRGVIYADPIARSRDLRHLGFAVGLVQDFGKHLQAGVRYDYYDADRDAFEQPGLTIVGVDPVFSTLGVMATARWREGRFLVQYDHERNPFGRGDNGAPLTRTADRLTLRVQVGF